MSFWNKHESPVSKQRGNQQDTHAYVYDVILDETHARAVDSSYVGAVIFRTQEDTTTIETKLPIAFPFDKHTKNLPVRNEKIELFQTVSSDGAKAGTYFYRRTGTEYDNGNNADPKAISRHFKPRPETGETGEDKVEQYKRVSETGIERKESDNTSPYDGFGNYFSPNPTHTLKVYEGDSIFESRFGQSIRYSAYNNLADKDKDGNPIPKYSPTIIIRNGQSSYSLNNKLLQESIEEDINRDGTIIALTSKEHQLDFKPGTIDDKGGSDFETKPESFQNYPSKLIGDQLFMNSGRIILSAKNGEMIFYSKKNYGFISDGGMSIDNKLGIDISVHDRISVVTNDRDVTFFTGNGCIYLGNKQLEPMVKGKQLVKILERLIDAIVAQQFLTPSGPSKIGPENHPTFGSIKSELNTILSQLNQTA
jgi:hypothetical protein